MKALASIANFARLNDRAILVLLEGWVVGRDGSFGIRSLGLASPAALVLRLVAGQANFALPP